MAIGSVYLMDHFILNNIGDKRKEFDYDFFEPHIIGGSPKRICLIRDEEVEFKLLSNRWKRFFPKFGRSCDEWKEIKKTEKCPSAEVKKLSSLGPDAIELGDKERILSEYWVDKRLRGIENSVIFCDKIGINNWGNEVCQTDRKSIMNFNENNI